MIKKKKEFWNWKDFILTSSFYFWGLETQEREVTCPKSFKKITTDTSLAFMSPGSQYNALLTTSNFSPIKILAQNNFLQKDI